MNRADACAIGDWPSRPPFGPELPAALWLAGDARSAVAAAWLAGHRLRWQAVVPSGLTPSREAAALETARRHGVSVHRLAAGAPTLAGLALAAAELEGGWLVLPTGEPTRLAAYERALQADGLAGLWTPLALLDDAAIARLALALGVDPSEAPD